MNKARQAPVTVIIPTYNREKMLIRAILSAACQTLVPERILVIDDGSTDNTENVVSAIKYFYYYHKNNTVPEIHYIRLPVNHGANYARNIGIANSKSKYIAFLDSDDFWHNTKLERQFEGIESCKIECDSKVLAFTGRLRTDGNLHLIRKQGGNPTIDKRLLLRSNCIGTLSSVVIDRETLLEVGGFDESLDACQDWDMYIRVIDKLKPIATQAPLIIYFDEGSGRLTGHNKKRLRSHLNIYKKHLKIMSKKIELSEFYRNISEDLSQLRRKKLTIKFLATHYKFKYKHKLAAIILAHLHWQKVKQIRYENYIRSQLRDNKVQKDALETKKYLDWYWTFHERALRVYESLPK